VLTHRSYKSRRITHPVGAPFPLLFRPSHGHRQRAQKIGKNRSSFRRYHRRQTDTHSHTQTCSLKYFATTPVGEVKTTDHMSLKISCNWQKAIVYHVRHWHNHN